MVEHVWFHLSVPNTVPFRSGIQNQHCEYSLTDHPVYESISYPRKSLKSWPMASLQRLQTGMVPVEWQFWNRWRTWLTSSWGSAQSFDQHTLEATPELQPRGMILCLGLTSFPSAWTPSVLRRSPTHYLLVVGAPIIRGEWSTKFKNMDDLLV